MDSFNFAARTPYFVDLGGTNSSQHLEYVDLVDCDRNGSDVIQTDLERMGFLILIGWVIHLLSNFKTLAAGCFETVVMRKFVYELLDLYVKTSFGLVAVVAAKAVSMHKNLQTANA